MYHCAETFLSSLSPPFAPIVTQWFYRAACCWKTRLRRSVSKEECFCVACRRVSLQVSTWNTKVFSYLICIHSHNEWTCLSCFQVRRVQTRLLFALSSDTCMLLPPVRALEPSHRLCPGWIFSCPFSSSLLLCVRSKKPFQINVWALPLFFFSPFSFWLLCYFNNTKSCHPKIALSGSKTHKLAV